MGKNRTLILASTITTKGLVMTAPRRETANKIIEEQVDVRFEETERER